MFLSRGDRDLGVAFQTHPGRQAFTSSQGLAATGGNLDVLPQRAAPRRGDRHALVGLLPASRPLHRGLLESAAHTYPLLVKSANHQQLLPTFVITILGK